MKSNMIYAVVLASASLVSASDICWRDSYSQASKGRGIHTCPSGYEKSGLLCYPKCRNGYYGVGPVCWSYCPSGWRDDGALCNNRGGWTIGSTRRGCPWYDVCGLWNRCTSCPSGTSNHGCTCHKTLQVRAKKSYGRGVGKPLQCASNEVQQGLFCYPKCPDRDGRKFDLVGHVCWERCSNKTPVGYGAACCKDKGSCAKWTASLSGAGIGIVGAIVATGGAGAAFAAASIGAGAGIFGGIFGAVAFGPGMADDLMQPFCGFEKIKLHGKGKCRGNPYYSVPDLISSECIQLCKEDSRCKFLSHAADDSMCNLYTNCALDTSKGWETQWKSDESESSD